MASNSTNFNSKVALNLVTTEGTLIQQVVIDDTLTHEINIEIPQIAGFQFSHVKDDVDLSSIQLDATNLTFELVYEERAVGDYTFTFSGTDGNSEATITGYSGTDTELELPSSAINLEAGWSEASPVVAIADSSVDRGNFF